jgi:hypothetical protein
MNRQRTDDPTLANPPPPGYPPRREGPGRELEQRIEREERQIVTNRALAVAALALAVLLIIAVSALVAGLVALNRDVEAVETARPAAGSVGTDALQNDAVTAEKIAAGAVTGDALAAGAVTAENVVANSLTGASIMESTLRRVPRAALAQNAAALEGLPASAFFSQLTLVRAQSGLNDDARKGPITASCPSGTSIVSGGASVEGATGGVAIVSSAPTSDEGWSGTAEAFAPTDTQWRLDVTAICAAGGR